MGLRGTRDLVGMKVRLERMPRHIRGLEIDYLDRDGPVHKAKVMLSGSDEGTSFGLFMNYLEGVGTGPDRHIHENEDEIFYIAEGMISAKAGDFECEAEAGDVLFLPRGVPHEYDLKSQKLYILGFVV